MLKILTFVTAALVALAVPLIAQESSQQREIIEAGADGAVILPGRGGKIKLSESAPRPGTPPLSCFPQRKPCWILSSEIPNTGT